MSGKVLRLQRSSPQGPYTHEHRQGFEDLMRGEYERVFGRVVHGVPFEIVNLRLDAQAARGDRAIDFDTSPATMVPRGSPPARSTSLRPGGTSNRASMTALDCVRET